jgi:hypothetical protein
MSSRAESVRSPSEVNVQLLNVGNDLCDLRREGSALLGCDFEMRKLRDFFDIGFCDWHNQ